MLPHPQPLPHLCLPAGRANFSSWGGQQLPLSPCVCRAAPTSDTEAGEKQARVRPPPMEGAESWSQNWPWGPGRGTAGCSCQTVRLGQGAGPWLTPQLGSSRKPSWQASRASAWSSSCRSFCRRQLSSQCSRAGPRPLSARSCLSRSCRHPVTWWERVLWVRCLAAGARLECPAEVLRVKTVRSRPSQSLSRCLCPRPGFPPAQGFRGLGYWPVCPAQPQTRCCARTSRDMQWPLSTSRCPSCCTFWA